MVGKKKVNIVVLVLTHTHLSTIALYQSHYALKQRRIRLTNRIKFTETLSTVSIFHLPDGALGVRQCTYLGTTYSHTDPHMHTFIDIHTHARTQARNF